MITKKFALGLILGASAVFPATGNAQSIFGGGNKLDPAFCNAHGFRETVVYIDDSILVTGDTSWAKTIYEKLTATLMPGERTTIVELSPKDGESEEIWSGCWPSYTPEQSAKISKQSHWFSTSPLASIKDQQKFFARDFGIAAEKIEVKGGRAAASVMIDPANPPQKSIIRALAADGARYAHSNGTIRAILYSDLAENSDLGSVFKSPAPPAEDYGSKLGTYLHRSVFYSFGIASDIKGDGAVQDTIHAFWNDAFRSMAANIGGIGTDLNVPNEVPVSSSQYDVSVKDGGEMLVGHLSLLSDDDGTLVDSWLGITRLRTSAINGTFKCTGDASAPSCVLDASTVGGIVTTSPTETVSLSSDSTSVLTGTIGVQGSSVNLPLAAKPIAK